MTYLVKAESGRRVGAIGSFGPVATFVCAETPEAAHLAAYDTIEHLVGVTVEEEKHSHLPGNADLVPSKAAEKLQAQREAVCNRHLISRRRAVRVVCDNGHQWETEINGTPGEVRAYYLGQTFTDEDAETGKETHNRVVRVDFLN